MTFRQDVTGQGTTYMPLMLLQLRKTRSRAHWPRCVGANVRSAFPSHHRCMSARKVRRWHIRSWCCKVQKARSKLGQGPNAELAHSAMLYAAMGEVGLSYSARLPLDSLSDSKRRTVGHETRSKILYDVYAQCLIEAPQRWQRKSVANRVILSASFQLHWLDCTHNRNNGRLDIWLREEKKCMGMPNQFRCQSFRERKNRAIREHRLDSERTRKWGAYVVLMCCAFYSFMTQAIYVYNIWSHPEIKHAAASNIFDDSSIMKG